MKQKVKTIFEALERAKVSMTDMAKITGISRVTLHRWKSGGVVTDRIRLNLAYGVAVRLNKACELGKIPLINRLKSEERIARLRNIVSSVSMR